MSNSTRDSLLPISPQEQALRRHCDTLRVMGNAVILFGIWSVAKVVMSLTLVSDEERNELLKTSGEDLPIVIGIIGCMLLLNLLLRLYMGLSARAEASGKNPNPLYIYSAGLLAIEYAFSLVYDLKMILDPSGNERLSSLADLIIVISSLTTLVSMVVNALRVRRLKKQLQEG